MLPLGFSGFEELRVVLSTPALDELLHLGGKRDSDLKAVDVVRKRRDKDVIRFGLCVLDVALITGLGDEIWTHLRVDNLNVLEPALSVRILSTQASDVTAYVRARLRPVLFLDLLN